MSRRMVVFISGVFFLMAAGESFSGIISFDPFPIGIGAYTNNADLSYMGAAQGPTNSPIVGFTGMWEGSTSLAESSTAVVDAPCALESGGVCRFEGYGDTLTRTLTRDFTEYLCANGDTNYWSVIISMTDRDSNDNAYIVWRDTDKYDYMSMRLGIRNGRLIAGLRVEEAARAVFLDLGACVPGEVYHLVARGVVNGGPASPNEATTVWVNPTRSDILNNLNVAAYNDTVSYISVGYNHDRVEISTQNIGGRTAYFDEILYTTDLDDLNLSMQEIKSATFDPMPRPDAGGSYNHLITHDFDLDSITLAGGRYTDVEGPTNVWVSGDTVYLNQPVNGETVTTAAEALTGLHVNFVGNISTADVTFATTVTSGFDGGFFIIEVTGDEYDFVILPLDGDNNPIGNWSLPMSSAYSWSDNLTGVGETALQMKFTSGGNANLNGLAFTLDDFTGGSGVLTGVHGLRIVDPTPTLDPVMIGIYQGPVDPLVSGSTTEPMTAATFNRVLDDNPITNDFAITGISTASRYWNTVEGAVTANIHVYSDSIKVYPKNGTEPVNTDAALEGLSVNGVLNTGYFVEFMFAHPVENPSDRIFIIDDISRDANRNEITIRPLDADRFPISTHSLEIAADAWGGSLTENTITYNAWGGSNTDRSIGGVTFGISDFAGGTGTVNSVWGIRVESYSSLDEKIDIMMVGRTKVGGMLILIK